MNSKIEKLLNEQSKNNTKIEDCKKHILMVLLAAI